MIPGNQRAKTALINVSHPRIAISIYRVPSNNGYAAKRKNATNIIQRPYNLTVSGFFTIHPTTFINLLGTKSAGAQITKMIKATTYKR
jgi:hypothetical protein